MHQPYHDPRRPPTEVTIRVTGLHCTNCALSLEKHLTRVGATAPSVDYATGRTTFSLANPEMVPEIVASIKRLGYDVPNSTQSNSSYHHRLIYIKSAVAAILTLPLLVAMFIPGSRLHDPWLQFVMATPVFIIGLQHFGLSAIRSLRAGVANMDVLISIGILSGYIASVVSLTRGLSHEMIFFEATASIVTFVMIGHLLEDRAVRKTTSAIESLSHLQPQQATRLITPTDESSPTEIVPLGSIQPGDLLRVNTGDKIPTDGIIERGSIATDESMLSGESLPIDRNQGDRVIGGSIAVSGSAIIRATAVGDDTILSSIVRLVQEAQQRKPSIQRIGDSVSAVFVPGVIFLSIFVLVLGVFVFGLTLSEALVRALAIAVVACPCAMGLATPTAIMVALGRAATKGILIRGGDTLERLAAVRQVAFDKTGTLTHGSLQLGELTICDHASSQEVHAALVALQRASSHPIAKAIVRELQRPALSEMQFSSITETKGLGIEGMLPDGTTYSCGGKGIAQRYGLSPTEDIIVLRNGVLIGTITLVDEVRPEARGVLADIQSRGLSTSLVSGDTTLKSEAVARSVGISTVHAEKSPEEKLAIIRSMQRDGPIAYVGDGINDAPTLAEASVGISLGSASDVAMHSAHVILMGDSLRNLPAALRLARVTVGVIKQNLFWAFFYNVLAIPLAALGYITPVAGALLMTLSDVMIVGNSLRIKLKTI